MKVVRSRMTYANLMATIAVFVALGGTGYAVTKLPKDSVNAKQIATGAVGKGELGKDAVGGAEVVNGSIKEGDLKAGVIDDPYVGTTTRTSPSANPDFQVLGPGFSFSTETAGELLIRMDAVGDPQSDPGGIYSTCGTGNPTIGLYLDGNPVPNSAITLVSGEWASFVITGVVSDVAPGEHEAGVGVSCPNESAQDFETSPTSTMTVLQVG